MWHHLYTHAINFSQTITILCTFNTHLFTTPPPIRPLHHQRSCHRVAMFDGSGSNGDDGDNVSVSTRMPNVSRWFPSVCGYDAPHSRRQSSIIICDDKWNSRDKEFHSFMHSSVSVPPPYAFDAVCLARERNANFKPFFLFGFEQMCPHNKAVRLRTTHDIAFIDPHTATRLKAKWVSDSSFASNIRSEASLNAIISPLTMAAAHKFIICLCSRSILGISYKIQRVCRLQKCKISCERIFVDPRWIVCS